MYGSTSCTYEEAFDGWLVEELDSLRSDLLVAINTLLALSSPNQSGSDDNDSRASRYLKLEKECIHKCSEKILIVFLNQPIVQIEVDMENELTMNVKVRTIHNQADLS